MKILIDNANYEKIRALYSEFTYDGVTTNPSILKTTGENPMTLLKKIRQFLPKDAQLHAQVISLTSEKMIEEAETMVKVLGEGLYVKIPVTQQGIKAMIMLTQKGIRVTATAVYTAMQGLIAGKTGASYVAPYVNRLDNMGGDGVQVAKDIHNQFKIHGMKTEVLAASFKNTQQILELSKFGIGAITAAPDVLSGLIYHPATTNAVKDFTEDFYALVGEGKTMLDC
ncbi:MAG: transaldolase family protein [Eubacteriaceae bacterium]